MFSVAIFAGICTVLVEDETNFFSQFIDFLSLYTGVSLSYVLVLMDSSRSKKQELMQLLNSNKLSINDLIDTTERLDKIEKVSVAYLRYLHKHVRFALKVLNLFLLSAVIALVLIILIISDGIKLNVFSANWFSTPFLEIIKQCLLFMTYYLLVTYVALAFTILRKIYSFYFNELSI